MRLKSELVPFVNSSSPRDVVAGGAGFAGGGFGESTMASPSASSSPIGDRQPRSRLCLAAKRAGSDGTRSHPFQGGEEGNELSTCASILTDITVMKEASNFLRPVDPVRDQVPTYLTFIAKPMDLGTISANLKAGKYKTAAEMRMDVHLVWKNCLVYNGSGSPIYTMCRKMAERFDNAYRSRVHPTRHQGLDVKVVHGTGMLGTRVSVYWQDDHEWYCGHLDKYNGDKSYHIMYDDGEEEWLTIPSVDVCILDSPHSVNDTPARLPVAVGEIANKNGTLSGSVEDSKQQRTPSVGGGDDGSASGPATEDDELPPHAAQCKCRECKERKGSGAEGSGRESRVVSEGGDAPAVPYKVGDLTIHGWGTGYAGKQEGGIISIGFSAKRPWRNPIDDNRGAVVTYECTVEEGGAGGAPLFVVTALVQPSQRWEGSTPSEPWVKAAKCINKRLGSKLTEVVSGSHLFGFTIPEVADVLERMHQPAMQSGGRPRGPTQQPQRGGKAKRASTGDEGAVEGGCGKRLKKSRDETLAVCENVLREIAALPDAEPFLSPVDPEADGLPDYFTYIDSPMDLGTVLENLDAGEHYATAHDVYSDVINVWRNCLIYFTDNSTRYRAARKLARQFEASYKARMQAPRQQGIDSFAHGRSWVGCSVKVHWRDDHQWYPAVIDDFRANGNKPSYHIAYDDGEQEWIELPSVDVYLDPSLALVAASAAASGSGYEGSRGGSAKAAAGSWSAGSPAKISKGGVGSRGRSGRGGATGGGDSVARMTPGAVVAWLENAGLGEYSQHLEDACIDGEALLKLRDMSLSHEAGGMPVFLALCKDNLGMTRVGHALKFARRLQVMNL